MTNEQILEAIFNNYKTIVAYYPYPTGGYGQENVIAETDNFNGSKYNDSIKNFVNLTVQLGAAVSGCHVDNKTAVQIQVHGLDFPVFCYRYDGKFCITKKIAPSTSVKNITWRIEM